MPERVGMGLGAVSAHDVQLSAAEPDTTFPRQCLASCDIDTFKTVDCRRGNIIDMAWRQFEKLQHCRKGAGQRGRWGD